MSGTFVLRRIWASIPTVFLILIITFSLVRFVPGDPIQAIMGEIHDPVIEAVLREQLGLNKPLLVQFRDYVLGLFRGDLGYSIRNRQPVTRLILDVLPQTMALAFTSMVLSILVGIPLGIAAAQRRNSLTDYASMSLAVMGRALPPFVMGFFLLIAFALRLRWFPTVGVGHETLLSKVHALILPACAVSLSESAMLARLSRSSLLDVLSADYVLVARSKGLSERIVVYRHALKNALIPLVTVIGMTLGRVLAGAVVIEKVFSRPGIGRLLVDAISGRDYPTVQGTVLLFGLAFVALNLIVDILYGVIDPRVRQG